MKHLIDKTSTVPAYIQLYHRLRGDIESGAYAYGCKLPSKRVLAEEIGMSVITVEHAYRLLCEEGYIESRPRSGYVVIYKASDFLVHTAEAAWEYRPPLTKAGESSTFPFTTLSKTIRRVMLDYGKTLFTKPDNCGCFALRAAITKYLERNVGIHATPEQVIIGAGAEYLYGLVAQLLGNRTVYALEDPSYDKIRQVYEAHHITCEMLKMGNRGIQSGELKRTRAQVLHVTPFNSYPSLVTADASKRQEYLQWARERDGYIVEDNYDSELTVSKKNEETVFSLSEEGRVIYINTFSHTVSSALRVGYMVLPASLTKRFEETLGFYSCTVSVLEQYVLAELINGGDFERHINRVRRERRKVAQTGNIK